MELGFNMQIRMPPAGPLWHARGMRKPCAEATAQAGQLWHERLQKTHPYYLYAQLRRVNLCKPIAKKWAPTISDEDAHWNRRR